MTTIGEMTLEDAAREAAGNWMRFGCFAWDRLHELDDPDSWAIVYTHNRDSRLLDRSNADAIAGAMEPFTGGDDPDVVMESHGHWAVGHVDGFTIRVYRGGEVTDAFRTYHDLAERLADYPILDEEDYGRREHDATLENIADAARRLKGEYDLPEGWEGDVYSWLSDHRQRAVENRDDQGGYPEEDDLRAAFEALGYERVDGRVTAPPAPMEITMDAETGPSDSQRTTTGLTWLELARHIAAMTPEQRRRPVYFCDPGTGHVSMPDLALAEGEPTDEPVQLLHIEASVIPRDSFYLVPYATTPATPSHPADALVLVALDLDDGEQPPPDFETATGVYYALSEVEGVDECRRMAWYFQQQRPGPA